MRDKIQTKKVGCGTHPLERQVMSPTFEESLAEVEEWACCGEPAHRVLLEHEMKIFILELSDLLNIDTSRESWMNLNIGVKRQMIKNEIMNLKNATT